MASDRSLCRVCLLESDAKKLFNWHEKMAGIQEELSWLDCFRRCTQLSIDFDVKAEAGISIKAMCLCTSCARELLASYQFITKAHKADQMLRLRYFGSDNQIPDVGCFEWVNVTHDKIHNGTNELCTPNEATIFEKSSVVTSVEPINDESAIENCIKSVMKCNDLLTVDIANVFSSELFEDALILENEMKTKSKRKQRTKGTSKILTAENELISVNNIKRNTKRHKPVKKNVAKLSDMELSEDEPAVNNRIKHTIERKKNLENIYSVKLLNEEGEYSKCSKEDVNIARTQGDEQLPLENKGKAKKKRNNSFMSEIVTCEQCSRKMERRHLKRHVSRYHRPKLLLCHACPRTFSVINNLRAHELTHQEQRDVFTCEQCGKKLRSMLTYKNHMKTHDVVREKIHHCDQCEKTFLHKSSLSLHQLQHKGSTIICNVCQKGFVRQIDMLIHQRIHTGERQYKCSQCDKSFTQQRVLNKHMKSHDGAAHLCNICGKKYSSYERLYYHCKEHTGMPYKCAACEKEFSEIYKLKRHIKGVHKMEDSEGIQNYIVKLNKLNN